MALVASFVQFVHPLSWARRAPVFRSFLLVLTGWLFAPRRTLTGMLVAAGVAGQRHHAAFHRVFAAARWSLDHVGLIVFSLDDTLAHKRGLKVDGVGLSWFACTSTTTPLLRRWGR